jgi:hypothetical protein
MVGVDNQQNAQERGEGATRAARILALPNKTDRIVQSQFELARAFHTKVWSSQARIREKGADTVVLRSVCSNGNGSKCLPSLR